MIVAITGGTGYLAQRITEYLLSKHIKIILLTRKKIKPNLNKNLRIIKIDWKNSLPITLEADLLIHTLRTTKINQKSSEKNSHYNEIILKKISNICNKNNINRLIYISSIHIYKDFNKSTNENFKKNFSKNNIYVKEKLFFEENLLHNSLFSNVNVLVLRLSNCFGAPINYSGDCWNLFINSVCKSAFEKNKIIIKNNIYTHRNFIPINFLNYVIHKLILAKKNKIKIMNIANDQSYSLKFITDMILKLIYKKYKIKPLLIENDTIFKNDSMLININKLKKMNLNVNKYFKDELNYLIDYCYNNFKN